MVTETTVSLRKARNGQRGFARAMRSRPMDAEKQFWWRVRDRRLDGHKFRRQFLIGKYIVDFVCLDRNLVIELDGGQHALQVSYDKERDRFLETRGFRVLRFWNGEVLTNMDGVLEGVLIALQQPPSPRPSTVRAWPRARPSAPPEGERGNGA